jgi:hypothetical protein
VTLFTKSKEKSSNKKEEVGHVHPGQTTKLATQVMDSTKLN